MEVLELNGEKYVKAAQAAKDLGYTADYIGQLCRSGKIKAQLVGRSWYVNEESLKSHKKSAYRSSKNKTQKAFRQAIDQQKKTEESESVTSASSHTSTIRSNQTNGLSYTEDSHDLIPQPHKEELIADEPVPVRVTHLSVKDIGSTKDFFPIKEEVVTLEPKKAASKPKPQRSISRDTRDDGQLQPEIQPLSQVNRGTPVFVSFILFVFSTFLLLASFFVESRIFYSDSSETVFSSYSFNLKTYKAEFKGLKSSFLE